VEDEAELVGEGEIMVLNPPLPFDLEGDLGYDCWVTNLGCEWDRRSGLEEK
jgi:hypothetical protein